jgi:hypothetical protein
MLTHPVGRNFKVGQKVHFGRPNGEKTLGEIIKLNPSKARIRTLEDRGSRSVAGVIWTVPYSLIKPADGAEATTAPVGLSIDDQFALEGALRSLVARYGLQAVSDKLAAIKKVPGVA